MSRSRLSNALRTRGVLPAIEHELDRLGVADYRLGMGGKHPFLRVSVNGRTKRIIFSGTPRGGTVTIKNAVRSVRKIIAAMKEETA